ncbi:MAG TPA: histidinol dehydrogenase [Candidatus Dormibacteraeota bacterium]|nr:histidinol dehydrogenase [Candidatus Dormibacteraeota bacterium]
MRILKLTPQIERQLLRSRQERDVEADQIAAQIIADVRKRGDAALFAWARKLDGVKLRRQSLWISPRSMRAAHSEVAPEFIRALRHAAQNVRRVAAKQLPKPWSLQVEPGVRISQLVRPIATIGCYIPGGRFALVSTLLMTVIPAQVAGVRRIVVICPRPNKELLAAADFLGINEFAHVGGAHGIAALAYGTRSIPRVDKIFGPGNRYVTAAKQRVSHDCAIDLPAGPTEAIVLATQGNPRWIAADLLAQAEHAPDAGSFLVTTSESLAKQVQTEIAAQLKKLPADNPAHFSIRKTGAILATNSFQSACTFVNQFAGEHLSIPDNADLLLKNITAAGTIFVGPWAAQPFGDYATGSNHVLPTGGWARARGGLSAADFTKCISVQTITKTGFSALANDVQILARAEGLLAHANAIEVRR